MGDHLGVTCGSYGGRFAAHMKAIWESYGIHLGVILVSLRIHLGNLMGAILESSRGPWESMRIDPTFRWPAVDTTSTSTSINFSVEASWTQTYSTWEQTVLNVTQILRTLENEEGWEKISFNLHWPSICPPLRYFTISFRTLNRTRYLISMK